MFSFFEILLCFVGTVNDVAVYRSAPLATTGGLEEKQSFFFLHQICLLFSATWCATSFSSNSWAEHLSCYRCCSRKLLFCFLPDPCPVPGTTFASATEIRHAGRGLRVYFVKPKLHVKTGVQF